MTMDTSRDESSAEVRLFLDGHAVGSGVCRFNKVSRKKENIVHAPTFFFFFFFFSYNQVNLLTRSQTN